MQAQGQLPMTDSMSAAAAGGAVAGYDGRVPCVAGAGLKGTDFYTEVIMSFSSRNKRPQNLEELKLRELEQMEAGAVRPADIDDSDDFRISDMDDAYSCLIPAGNFAGPADQKGAECVSAGQGMSDGSVNGDGSQGSMKMRRDRAEALSDSDNDYAGAGSDDAAGYGDGGDDCGSADSDDSQGASIMPRRNERGKLKIFLGAAPGVGKTFAMLSEAAEKSRQGEDIVIGWIENQNRADISSLVSNFEIIERMKVSANGFAYDKLDIARIIMRRPDTVLVDVMPVTNPPYSVHKKRWQDIDELLDEGINVYSTLNIENLDSMKDIVSRVTGIEVAETVPDSIFDRADEIRLVDFTPDDLIDRLNSGKLTMTGPLEKAHHNYFKKSNLIALRELTMRIMTSRVDSDAKLSRHITAHSSVRDTNFGLLLVLEYVTDFDAIRQAARIAHTLSGGWHCIWVKKNELSSRERLAINEMLNFAQSLGAVTDTVTGSYAQAVSGYARSHNLSIVAIIPAGKWRFSRVSRSLKEIAPELSILSLAYQVKVPPLLHRFTSMFRRSDGRSMGIWQVLLGNLVLTGIFYPLYGMVHRTNFAMGYMLLSFYFSVRYGTIAASLSAFVSIFFFDLWMVEPRGSLIARDIQYFWSFLVILIVNMVAARLISHRQEMTFEANMREQQTRMLYEAARNMASVVDERAVFNIMTSTMHSNLGIECEFWSYHEKDQTLTRQQARLDNVDEKVVHWCLQNRKEAALLPDLNFTWPGNERVMPPLRADDNNIYLPLVIPTAVLGVAVLQLPVRERWSDPGTQRVILALMSLTAQTLERLSSVEESRQTLMNMEAARLRTSLLQSLSHDLRTPLTSLMNNAETLLNRIRKQDMTAAEMEARELVDSSQRIVTLMSNLIEMARLQNDSVTLKKTWIPADELIGMAKATLKDRLKRYEVSTAIDPECPLFYGDPVLLERVLANILDNATKYCPEGSKIVISAALKDGRVTMAISDNGPGLPDDGSASRIFDPFKRGQKESHVAGVGLGLAIVKTIASVHDAEITASRSDMGGACFTLALPYVAPPELDDEDLMLKKIEASGDADIDSPLSKQPSNTAASVTATTAASSDAAAAASAGAASDVMSTDDPDDVALMSMSSTDDPSAAVTDVPSEAAQAAARAALEAAGGGPRKKGKWDDIIIG